MQLMWLLSSLPADERQKSAAGLQTSGWGLRGGREDEEEEERWGLREGGRHTNIHTHTHIYSPLLTAVGIKDQLAKSGLSAITSSYLVLSLSLSSHSAECGAKRGKREREQEAGYSAQPTPSVSSL